MREIKFRARMIDPSDHEGCFVHSNLGMMLSWNSKNGRYYGFVNWETLGEYTGKEDENGKEIYEGDISEYYHEGIKEIVYAQIFYYDKWCGFARKTKFKTGGALIEHIQDDENIVGNIYENPELMKTEDAP